MAKPATSLQEEARKRGLLKDHKPEAKADGIRHLDLDGPEQGHWIEYRVQVTGRELQAMLRAAEDFAAALDVVGSRIVKHSFGGHILDQPLPVLIRIVQRWNRESEDYALDPPSATD